MPLLGAVALVAIAGVSGARLPHQARTWGHLLVLGLFSVAGVWQGVSHELTQQGGDEVDREKCSQNRDPTTTRSGLGEVGEPAVVQLMRDGDRGERPGAMLAQDQVGLTGARIVPLPGVRPVDQDHHVRVLLQ